MAFIWLADDLYPSKQVADRMQMLLRRVEEKI
jgi:hypothetical protein